MRIAVIMFMLACPLLAATQWQKASKRLRVSEDLRVSFTQQVMTLRKKVRHMQGEAYFAADGKFRWLMLKQGKQNKQVLQAYIYDGKTVVEHLPQEKLANVWTVGSGQVAEISRIVQLVKTLDNLERDYKVKETTDAGTLVLTLTPRKATGIDQIILRVAKTDTFISYVKIEYRGSRYSEYRFSQPVHKKLPAAHFTFTPPVGTKVMMVN